MDPAQMNDLDKKIMQLLQEFLIENPDLEQLEKQLNPFNIFEALGAVRVELRHSDFLAFLLNPAQNHGLGDLFVRNFLERAVLSYEDPSLNISPIDLELWDFDDIEVRREWQNIDILLIDSNHHFAVIIENKVFSGEHSEQLQRYQQIVHNHFPDYKVLSLFLTPERTTPTDENYVPIDYGMVIEVLDKIQSTKATAIDPDVRILINHYIQMLRRHIVNDQLEELCRRIYRKHKSALDLIYECRPDQQAYLQEVLEEQIKATEGLKLIRSSKSYISFKPNEWEVPSLIDEGSYWRNVLYFEIENYAKRLQLKLYIGPGPVETRQKLYNIACNNKPFHTYKSFRPKWNTIFMTSFLIDKNYQDVEDEELGEIVRSKWAQFARSDLVEIEKIIRRHMLNSE